MNISHELKDGKIVLLNITLTSDEIKDEVSKQLKQMRKSAEIHGFRRGMAPASIIEKKYGKAVRYDIINKQSSREVAQYLKEQGIKTVGGILIEHDDNSYTPEQVNYELQISTGLLPEYPGAFDNSVTLPHYTIETKDSEIDEMISNAQAAYGERKEVDDVQEKDILYVSAQELDDKGAHNEGGISIKETFLMPSYILDEEIRTQVLKAHKGDTLIIDLHKAYKDKAVEIASFLQIGQDEVKDHRDPFEIKITRILRSSPHPLDEKLYKLMLGPSTTVATEEELRAKLKSMQEEQHAKLSEDLFTSTVSRYVLEQIQGLAFSDEHLRLLVRGKDDETVEEFQKRVEGILPYMRYQYILSDLIKTMGVDVSEDLVRSILLENIKSRIQTAGLGQLLSNDEFVNRILADELEKDGESLYRAREQAKERAFADNVKELITLDEQPAVAMDEVYKVYEKEQTRINELLGYPSDKAEAEVEKGAEEA